MISGLSAEQHRSLANALSYTSGSYFAGRGVRKVSLLSKRGEFPTGLLSIVRKAIPQAVLADNRKRPPGGYFRGSFSGIIPYESQIEALDKAITHSRGILALPTGAGKSLVIAMIASMLGVRTLIVVPSLEIKRQLLDSFEPIFGHNLLHWIVIENIDSKRLKTVSDFDCLIIDEAHHTAAKTYRKLNKTAWKDIFYRFHLTATPFRNDPEEELLFKSIAGEIIYKLSYQAAISKGYIVPVESFYIETPKQATDAYTYAQVYNQLVVNNDHRNELVASMLLRLEGLGKSTLCLVKEVAHGRILSDLTGIPFVCGEDDESRDFIRQFNSGGIPAVIGTTGVLGEGVDTKPCEYVVIASPGKAKSQFMQQVGRAIRTYPGKESAKIIIFKDKSHKFLLRHFNAQAKILLDEYGNKPIKLDV